MSFSQDEKKKLQVICGKNEQLSGPGRVGSEVVDQDVESGTGTGGYIYTAIDLAEGVWAKDIKTYSMCSIVSVKYTFGLMMENTSIYCKNSAILSSRPSIHHPSSDSHHKKTESNRGINSQTAPMRLSLFAYKGEKTCDFPFKCQIKGKTFTRSVVIMLSYR